MSETSEVDEVLLLQVEMALLEDAGPGDITTLGCIDDGSASAEIVAKSDGVLAGLAAVEEVFRNLDKRAQFSSPKNDGQRFTKGNQITQIKAGRRAVLTGERTALNFLGHLSGIATLTSKFVSKIAGTRATILDTRKTTPGLRFLEKYAVACGGGENHRYGLFDMVLIKDNHISLSGSITEAVNKVRQYVASDDFKKLFVMNPTEVEIEVEVESLDQLKEAVGCGINRLLLDNQSIGQLSVLVTAARKMSPDLKLEASGNVSLENVRAVAETGVDFISIGALTHSAPSSDFSLRIIS